MASKSPLHHPSTTSVSRKIEHAANLRRLTPSSAAAHPHSLIRSMAHARGTSRAGVSHMRVAHALHTPPHGLHVACASAWHMPHARATCRPSLHVQLHFQLQLNSCQKTFSCKPNTWSFHEIEGTCDDENLDDDGNPERQSEGLEEGPDTRRFQGRAGKKLVPRIKKRQGVVYP